MKKGREVRNLPVISAKSGAMLGVIKDFKLGGMKVEGFYLQDGSQQNVFLPLAHVNNIGPDAVLADGWLASQGDGPKAEEAQFKYAGIWVMTAGGQSLGTVEDIVMEEKDGSIVGYEISDGYLKDLMMGRKVVSTADILTYGSDAVIVSDTCFE